MRTAMFALALTIGACGGKATTPAGPVGKPLDFRSKLKPELVARAPSDEKATRREMPADINGVKAKLVWRTFEDGPNKYILSTQWEVVTPSPAITIEPIDTTGMMPTNAGSPEAVNQRLTVRVRWQDHASSSTKLGESAYTIDASGEGRAL